MQRAYQYKARLSPTQHTAAMQQLKLHRRLYNAALEARKGSYDRIRWRMRYGTPAERAALRQTLPTYATQNRELTLIRADDPAYRAMASSAEQRTLRRLDKAFQAFFRRVGAGQTPGYPRFKGRGRFTSLEFTAGNGARIEGNRAYFQGIGSVKLRLYRPLPDGAVVKALWLTLRASGWWVVCSLALPEPCVPPKHGPVTAIDVGLRHYVMAADGSAWDAPRPYEQALKALRRKQRSVARKQRGSNRRAQAVHELARQHERIANARKGWQRKLAVELCARYAAIGVEELDIADRMVQSERYAWAKRGLNRGTYDAAWAQFVEILRLRAERDGVAVIGLDPKNSTQQCSRCGELVPKTIFDRLHDCPHCGLQVDQDLNAALNLAQHEVLRLRALKESLRGPVGARR